ncbi:MAG: NAD(P)/FAD-dependent oxidoreductase [Chloroflexi bacterium]|nr:NAD(P)/FAD-dependent oxidoreductase [Chloroflexota bacterium]
MAAGRAAETGASVLLLEKTDRPGKKLLISGKGRCNVTNTRELDDFIAMYGPNGRFLYSAFHRFFREELLDFLQRFGVETKSERGGRVFPVSDDAREVVKALEGYLAGYGVDVRTGDRATGIGVREGRVTGVEIPGKFLPAGAVVLAAGGASYPHTGSSGDGYRMAAALGHTVTKLRPALVPLVVYEAETAGSMQGVSLRNVRLTSFRCPADQIDPALTPASDWGRGAGRKRPPPPVIESRQGEMMFTHFGIGGPVTLLMSLAMITALETGPVSVSIDLKPALNDQQLRQRLQRDFEEQSKRSYRNILKGLLPQKMVDPFVGLTGIPPEKPGHQITGPERETLLRLLKSLRFNIKGPLSMEAAIATSGGVSLDEIDPRTMASRLVKGLYFCGEVVDLDADTGGFNLQAAFSTGYVAGEEAAKSV